MNFNNDRVEEFLKDVLFSNDACQEHKHGAYDLLVAATIAASMPQGNGYQGDRVLIPGTFLSLHPDAYRRINDLIRAERLLEAVKMVRVETGLGLKEAKDAVWHWAGRS